MDGVLCNFYKAAKQALTDNPNQKYPQSQWGFFLKLEEIPGAIEGFRKLRDNFRDSTLSWWEENKHKYGK
jgi:hypothetical protein